MHLTALEMQVSYNLSFFFYVEGLKRMSPFLNLKRSTIQVDSLTKDTVSLAARVQELQEENERLRKQILAAV